MPPGQEMDWAYSITTPGPTWGTNRQIKKPLLLIFEALTNLNTS